MRMALIGVGSIGRTLIDGIARGLAGPARLAGVADVPAARETLVAVAREAGCPSTTEPLRVLDWKPDLVVEAASQQAVREYAVALLAAGVDLMVMSVGALADPGLLREVAEAAEAGGRRVFIPSGAIGGLDALRAARMERLDEVTLATSKPPRALAGAPFFERHPVDLGAIVERTLVYEGAATEAVRLFPANVNVVAAVSLAGLGPDRTRIQIFADPGLDRNVHELRARGAFGELTLTLRNLPSPANPKTSLLASLSALATLRRMGEAVQVG